MDVNQTKDVDVYNLTVRILHWIMAFSIIGMFVLGLWMVDLGYYDVWRKDAPEIHKSIGILLFILLIFRLAWRRLKGVPSSLSSHSRLERVGAHAAHFALYGLLFAIMISGYLISTADGRPISVFGFFDVPALGSLFEKQEDIAGDIHLVLAIAAISIATMHALAALKHHFIDKDKTLMRMIRMPKP